MTEYLDKWDGDIVRALRFQDDQLCELAADTIATLRAENERLCDAIADYATFDTNAGRAMRLLQHKSNELLTLSAEITRLRAALEPFVCKCRVKGEGAGGNCTTKTGECSFWTARIALEGK